jgi:ATP/maltotriose-dependent transcriptional regulator MalT
MPRFDPGPGHTAAAVPARAAAGAQTIDDGPLIGRAEELAFLRRLRSLKTSSAVLMGPAGVGKSRLAAAAAAEAAAEGWVTIAIRGSDGFAGVPLGPLRTVLQLDATTDLSELTAAVSQVLVGMSRGRGLLVSVDDGHDLDDATAALLHQLVAAGTVSVLVTIRTRADMPGALTALWKDDLAARVELLNLTHRETEELLGYILGQVVETSTAERIWKVTDGNPLYVREVVLSSIESGALREDGGEWRWRGTWATGSRLQEIVATRLGRLDPDELTAVEMLALAGSLPVELLSGLSTPDAIGRLETRGLVSAERSGRRLEVRMAHHLHAEVMRERTPLLQQRAAWRALADALGRTPSRRSSDRIRAACWSLEAGLEVDLVTLTLGAHASLLGQSLSARLSEILPGVGGAPHRTSSSAVPRNVGLAVRLARAAYERSHTVPEGAALASALAWSGDIEGSEAILEDLTGQATSPDDRLRLAIALGRTRFWGRYQVEEATSVLLDAAENAPPDCNPALLAQVYQGLAEIEMHIGHPARALEYAQKIAAVQGVEVSDCSAAAFVAPCLGYLGRVGEAMALIERALPLALGRDGHEIEVGQLLFVQAGALLAMGQLEQAEEIAQSCREVSLAANELDAAAVYGLLAADTLLRQGRPATAGRLLRDAVGLLAEGDRYGYRPWALTLLARARAEVGDEEGSAAALDEARRTQPVPRHFDGSRYLAEVALHSLAGRSRAAAECAREGVAWAREAGYVAAEAFLLDAWLRVERSDEATARLKELAAKTDSDLIAALAEHAAALGAGDPEGLLAASKRFEQMPAFSMAAEAAAVAARICTRQRDARAAQAASRVALALASRCEGSRLPAVSALVVPVSLSKREIDVARLAVTGRSSKEIAERMHLSVRTVDSHLYHAYVKLGVTDRAGLAGALADATAAHGGTA